MSLISRGHRTSFFFVSFLLMFPFPQVLPAEEGVVPGSTNILAEKALIMVIRMEVVRQEELLWDRETRKLTIPGRPVVVRMQAPTLRLQAELTPYVQKKPDILLVAQGQIWVEGAQGQGVRYLTTLQSLPVNFHEAILFFPMGQAEPGQDELATLRMVIQVFPYQELADPSEVPGDGEAQPEDAEDESSDSETMTEPMETDSE